MSPCELLRAPYASSASASRLSSDEMTSNERERSASLSFSTVSFASHRSPVAGFNPFRSLTTQADLHSPQTSLSLPLFSHPFSAASRAEKADEVKAGRVKVLRRAVREAGEKGRKVVGFGGGDGILERPMVSCEYIYGVRKAERGIAYGSGSNLDLLRVDSTVLVDSPSPRMESTASWSFLLEMVCSERRGGGVEARSGAGA